jgi:hypothetical protein
VLNQWDVLLNRSLSHLVSQENHLEYHIVSTLYTEENDTPITWAPSPLTGVHIVSSRSHRGMTHPSHEHPHPTHGHTHRFISNDTPISWASSPHTQAHSVPSQSQRRMTHPSHGHTQLMGSLIGNLTQSQRRTCPGGRLMKR